MTLQNPAVTIGLMTHNYGHYVREAIESVLAQTRADWEMVVSDDASDDDTAQIVAPYLRDPRLQYVRHTENMGQAGNWSYLLAQGTAPVIGVLHADDAWLPGALAAVLPEFAASAETEMVFGNWRRRSGDAEAEVRLNQTQTLTGHALYRRQITRFTASVSATFVRRELIARAGMPDSRLKMVVDYEYFLRLAAHARRARSLADVLAVYRVHRESTTRACSSSGVFSDEKEALPAICAAVAQPFPVLRPCLGVLRRQLARSLFSGGVSEAAQGDWQAGRALIERALRLDGRLLLGCPRLLPDYLLSLCGPGSLGLSRRLHSRRLDAQE